MVMHILDGASSPSNLSQGSKGRGGHRLSYCFMDSFKSPQQITNFPHTIPVYLEYLVAFCTDRRIGGLV